MPDRIFQRIDASFRGRSDSRGKQFVRWLVGPNIIDLPIRAFALIYIAAGSPASAYESGEPLYVLLHLLGLACVLLAAFVPATAGACAAGLFLVFLLVYPEYVNPLLEPIIFAAAVLLAKLRWRLSLLLTVIAFLATWLEHLVPVAAPTPYWLVTYSVTTGVVLALAGAYLSWRVQRETTQRIMEARETERKTHEDRLAALADTHDTVSHSLATQAAIAQLLATEANERERNRLVGELLLVNNDAQQQFRELLSRLAEADEGTPELDVLFEPEARRLLQHLGDAASTAGIPIHQRVDTLPLTVSPQLRDDVALVLRELVTNIIKHAGQGHCELSIAQRTAPTHELVLSASNQSEHPVRKPPKTLSQRAAARGGSCEITHEDHVYRVTLTFPLDSSHASPE